MKNHVSPRVNLIYLSNFLTGKILKGGRENFPNISKKKKTTNHTKRKQFS